jgi:membrane-associated phospholipid phosphatase
MNVANPTPLRNVLHSRYLREPLLIVFCYIPYFLARGHAVSNARTAFDHASETIRFEKSLGILAELSVQSATLSYTFLIHLANIVYFYGHWPVILVFGAYLFVKNPRVYVITRNAFLISGAIALILYTFFPVAPPRLSFPGISDTLSMTVPVSFDKSRLVNPYAALPSLHVGWDLLIALGIFFGVRQWFVRYPALLLPPAMLLATVVTGNHFFIDGIAGALLASTAFFISYVLWTHWPAIQMRASAAVRPMVHSS